MHIFDEPKIDCHAHVIDPAHFQYGKNIAYKPAGQEIGTTAQFRGVMSCYGVKHALLVSLIPDTKATIPASSMRSRKARGASRASQSSTWMPASLP
jgi:hypothetical protein